MSWNKLKEWNESWKTSKTGRAIRRAVLLAGVSTLTILAGELSNIVSGLDTGEKVIVIVLITLIGTCDKVIREYLKKEENKA